MLQLGRGGNVLQGFQDRRQLLHKRLGLVQNQKLNQNKMKPTNPNAHTHDTDTDVQTQFAKHRFPLQ